VNTLGTLNLVLSLLGHAPDCHLLFISSAEVYGRSAFDGQPVDETALLQPANPYAATKAAADLLVQEASGRGLQATILRPFNHTGPGQTDNFAVPSFCRQIAQIEKGLQPPVLKVGELDDERDFLDVDDVIDLYMRVIMARSTLPNGLVLNVASGQPRRIRDLVEVLVGASSSTISVEVDPARIRATRVPRIIGNPGRARHLLEWRPKTSFESTLLDTLDYWRSRT
jgi:GDP-4-dehydro-6-deoxy-D-mannose reductase